MTNDTDLEKAREWLSQRTVPLTSVEEVARFRAEAVVEGSLPWTVPPLNEWAICGMNHYHVAGERCLFVSMTKDGRCITAEGHDEAVVWEQLRALADEREPNP